MRDDFNKEAMELKIKKNIEGGFTIDTIKVALREEMKTNFEKMSILHARNFELQDQIEYMDLREKSDGS